MTGVQRIEARRRTRQQRLDAERTAKERNRLGQFATPPDIALDIMRHARDLIGEGEAVRFLEPAIGSGAFYSALLQTFDAQQIGKAQGFEIDERFVTAARDLWQGKPLEVAQKDFTRAQPPWLESERFTLLIANPPYVRHHHLSKDDKERLQHQVNGLLGYHLSQLSGLYCYFLLLSHLWLQEGGLACWLIPSEFMDVNYGRAVKQYLLNEVTVLRIHRYDEAATQFDDALVSSAVLWLKKGQAPPEHQVAFTYGSSHGNPEHSFLVRQADLKAGEKWTRFNRATFTERRAATHQIKDLFKVKRGLATGDNSFFVLDAGQVEKWQLPKSALRPILPSPRYLKTDIVEADQGGAPLIQKRLFLLDASMGEQTIKTQFPTLHAYLQHGRERGVQERYLCKNRQPWYSQEKRPAAPILCTYMGRKGGAVERPFRFILNQSAATAANSYLLLYPTDRLAALAEQDPDIYRRIWEQLNHLQSDELIDGGRTYGGGLHKLEPKELGSIAVPVGLHRLTV